MQKDLVTPHLRDTKKALDEVSSSFCLAKWLQVTLHLQNGNSQSCHHVKAHRIDLRESEQRPAALHNTAIKIKARKKMLTGKRPQECAYCWKAEDQGRISDRVLKSSDQWALPHMQKVVASSTGREITPSYLEVSFDSTCNFRCMYCSPSFSSSWMEEIKQYGSYPTSFRFNNLKVLEMENALPVSAEERQRYIQTFWKWWPDLVPKLDSFRITGGEPFLSDETYRMLEWLNQNPQPSLNLSINTNMGLGPNKLERVVKLINGLKGKVNHVILFTSIDSVGAQAEYIRFGLDYSRFCKNLTTLLAQVEWPITVAYMITVNALSLPGMKDLMAFILEQRRAFPNHKINFDTPFLQNPAHMSVEVLTPDFAKYLDSAKEFMLANMQGANPEQRGFSEIETVKVDRIRDLLMKPNRSWLKQTRLRRDFVRMFKEYDRRRKTDFHATFPEYREFWDQCEFYNWL